jgi:RNA 2',3'-cyclic 3'-phosphodiesterase
MPRLFVAVVVPEPARDRLLAVRPAALPGLRLVGRDEMHLTLHFLGAVGEGQLATVVRALAGVKAAPFAVAVRGVGQFPLVGEAEVLWAGLAASPPLSALHHAVGIALTAAVGFQPEDRPYVPHVTLAHLKEAPAPGWVEDYLREHAALHIPSVPVARFALYSSVRTPDGPRYRIEAAFALSETGSRGEDRQTASSSSPCRAGSG